MSRRGKGRKPSGPHTRVADERWRRRVDAERERRKLEAHWAARDLQRQLEGWAADEARRRVLAATVAQVAANTSAAEEALLRLGEAELWAVVDEGGAELHVVAGGTYRRIGRVSVVPHAGAAWEVHLALREAGVHIAQPEVRLPGPPP